STRATSSGSRSRSRSGPRSQGRGTASSGCDPPPGFPIVPACGRSHRAMPDTRDGGLLDRIIMVVDGDDEAREGLSNFLRSCGYPAFGETAVWRALAYLDMGLRPWAIVLDVPEPDAMEFRSAQVRDPRVRGIPVIVGARLGEKPTLSEAETGTPIAQAT